MAQYISKSALIVEIEKRGNICKKVVLDLRTEENKDYYQGKAEAYKETLDLLDTLEVKEVDLEKEINAYMDNEMRFLPDEVGYDTFSTIAKHFFELGLNTQHSSINIPNIDDILEEDGVDPFSKEAKIFKESYYMALEKIKAQKGEQL